MRGGAGCSARTLGSSPAALRRIRANLTDVANFEPIALLPVLLLRGATRRRVGRGVLLAFAVVVVQVFVAGPSVPGDEVTPGAGASALAAVLPVEHALIALALVLSVPRSWLARACVATLAFAIAGFAVHASHDHERRAMAGLGRPHYEPDVAREAGASHGLLFFDDDEGYELAHDPGVLASHGVVAVRSRGDDHDRLLYDLLGHPQTHRYLSSGRPAAAVSAWTPSGTDTWRFEAEADFPPVAVSNPRDGRVEVIDATGTCASDARALVLTPARPAGDGSVATVAIELPVPRGASPSPSRTWMVTPRVLQARRRGERGFVPRCEPRRAPPRSMVVDRRDRRRPLLHRPSAPARRTRRGPNPSVVDRLRPGRPGSVRQDHDEGSLTPLPESPWLTFQKTR